MIRSLAELELRAHAIGTGMTDKERIALGVTLIETVLAPDSHRDVQRASRLIREHGDALQAFHLTNRARAYGLPDLLPATPECAAPANATTHEQTGAFGLPGTAGPGPQARASFWRRAWERFRAAERRFEDSWAGDILGASCLIIIFVSLVFAAGVLS